MIVERYTEVFSVPTIGVCVLGLDGAIPRRSPTTTTFECSTVQEVFNSNDDSDDLRDSTVLGNKEVLTTLGDFGEKDDLRSRVGPR